MSGAFNIDEYKYVSRDVAASFLPTTVIVLAIVCFVCFLPQESILVGTTLLQRQLWYDYHIDAQ